MLKLAREIGILTLLCVLLASCAQRVDVEKPLDQVRAEASQMTEAELNKTISAYIRQIEQREKKFERLKTDAKRMSAKEVFGPKGEEIKNSLSNVRNEIQQLNIRYHIYMDFKDNPPLS